MESQLSTLKENIMIIWFNDSTMGEINDLQKIKDQFEHNSVGILCTFDDADECVNFINDVNPYQIVLVLGPSTGAKVLRKVLDVSQFKAVFIVCSNRSMRPSWGVQYKSIKYVTVDSTSIYQQIEILTANNTVGIDVLDSPITLTNQNQQDVRFMYNQLIKYVLTEMVYSNDDKNDMIEFFENKYKHEPVTMKLVKEFGDNYKSNETIWYYTNYTFLYKTVNSALRTIDIVALYSMRVFLKDLHLQIIKLHATRKQITEILKLYRGLVISTAEFEKLKEKTGKLLSFSNFLSTSANKNVALMYAGLSQLDETTVIFEITIDPSILPGIPFTCIQEFSQYADEDEYLFTMGSIFRIESIERAYGNPDWCIHLTLTTDHDPEISELVKCIQSELKQPNILSLCTVLEYMGKYDEIIDIINAYIKSCKDENKLSALYMILGIIHMQVGNYRSGLEAFQLFYKHSSRCSESEYNIIQTNMVAYFVNALHEKWDLALDNLETIKQNIYRRSNTRNHEDTTSFAMLNIMKSRILQCQGNYVDALKCQTESYNMFKENMPLRHPLKIMPLLLIGLNYQMNNQADDAYLCMQQAMDIQRHSIPPEHFLRILLDDTLTTSEYLKDVDLSSDYSITNLSDYIKNPSKLFVLCIHLMNTKKYKEALLVINQYIKFTEEHSTIQHMHVTLAYFLRGISHEKTENLTEALNDFKQSYENGIQCSVRAHPVILNSLIRTAEIYVKLDNYDQVLVIIEQCNNWIATNLQSFSTDGKKSLFQFVLLKLKLKAHENFRVEEFEKALLCFKNYLKLQIYILSDDHSDLGETYQCIAITYNQLKNYTNALYNYKKARSILEKYLPINDPKIICIWNNLRFIYFQLKQYDEALFASRKYLEFQESTFPLDYISIAENYKLIACIYTKQQKYLDGIENYNRALNIQLQHLPETCLKTIDTLKILGRTYMLSHQYEESLMIFYECLEYQLNVLSSDHIDVLETYKIIALLCNRLEE